MGFPYCWTRAMVTCCVVAAELFLVLQVPLRTLVVVMPLCQKPSGALGSPQFSLPMVVFSSEGFYPPGQSNRSHQSSS